MKVESELGNVPSELPWKWMIRQSGSVKDRQNRAVSMSACLIKHR